MPEFACRLCNHQTFEAITTFQAWLHHAANSNDERKLLADTIARVPDLHFGNIVRCNSCGLRSVEHVPSRPDLGDFYRGYHANGMYRTKAEQKINKALGRVRRLQRHVSTGTFLDVGCNLGFAVEAARRSGFSATGIDIDSVAIAKAQAFFPEAEFVCTTAEEFSSRGRRFDLVYCAEVIEHVPDLRSFAAALSALTKAGGTLYLTTPDAGHFSVPRKFGTWKETKPPEHLTWFEERQLTSLFQQFNFRVSYRFNIKAGLRMIALGQA